MFEAPGSHSTSSSAPPIHRSEVGILLSCSSSVLQKISIWLELTKLCRYHWCLVETCSIRTIVHTCRYLGPTITHRHPNCCLFFLFLRRLGFLPPLDCTHWSSYTEYHKRVLTLASRKHTNMPSRPTFLHMAEWQAILRFGTVGGKQEPRMSARWTPVAHRIDPFSRQGRGHLRRTGPSVNAGNYLIMPAYIRGFALAGASHRALCGSKRHVPGPHHWRWTSLPCC